MAIVDRIAERHGAITAWRREIHQNPELLYDVHKTAAFVADRLREFGVDDIATGIGRTGVVATIKGAKPGNRMIGLRADMDALPIKETTGKPYASQIEGRMHACGHDGHTAMLLGAAQHLAETRDFAGTVVVIFQPAEEGGAGARAMIEDGLMQRWPIDEVYGMHNLPGLSVGAMSMRAGPVMASTDEFVITINGRGGHAALPHLTIDPLLAAAALVQALQSVVSRNVDPVAPAVLSVTKLNAGNAFNVIPDQAELAGTLRALADGARATLEERLRAITESVCAAFDTTASINFRRGYPVTSNHAEQTAFCAEVAGDVLGADSVSTHAPPIMGGEDFSFMLQERPGSFVFLGNGDSAALHNPNFDFNDDIIPFGCSFWVRLVETALPA
ncbi:MAG: M20 aminoacylase family protein [Alphaproteobacteria bacterium]